MTNHFPCIYSCYKIVHLDHQLVGLTCAFSDSIGFLQIRSSNRGVLGILSFVLKGDGICDMGFKMTLGKRIKNSVHKIVAKIKNPPLQYTGKTVILDDKSHFIYLKDPNYVPPIPAQLTRVKLTSSQKQEIKRLRYLETEAWTVDSIAERFKCTRMAITDIAPSTSKQKYLDALSKNANTQKIQ